MVKEIEVGHLRWGDSLHRGWELVTDGSWGEDKKTALPWEHGRLWAMRRHQVLYGKRGLIILHPLTQPKVPPPLQGPPWALGLHIDYADPTKAPEACRQSEVSNCWAEQHELEQEVGTIKFWTGGKESFSCKARRKESYRSPRNCCRPLSCPSFCSPTYGTSLLRPQTCTSYAAVAGPGEGQASGTLYSVRGPHQGRRACLSLPPSSGCMPQARL